MLLQCSPSSLRPHPQLCHLCTTSQSFSSSSSLDLSTHPQSCLLSTTTQSLSYSSSLYLSTHPQPIPLLFLLFGFIHILTSLSHSTTIQSSSSSFSLDLCTHHHLCSCLLPFFLSPPSPLRVFPLPSFSLHLILLFVSVRSSSFSPYTFSPLPLSSFSSYFHAFSNCFCLSLCVPPPPHFSPLCTFSLNLYVCPALCTTAPLPPPSYN
jgi:hypothetical protein